MLILRFALVVVALAIVFNAAMYLFTRDRKYYRYAWQVIRFSALMLVVFGLLYVLERYVLVAWRVLL